MPIPQANLTVTVSGSAEARKLLRQLLERSTRGLGFAVVGVRPQTDPIAWRQGLADLSPLIAFQEAEGPQAALPHIEQVFTAFRNFTSAQVESFQSHPTQVLSEIRANQEKLKADLAALGLAQHIDWTQE